jgi:uncharacterized membrane protein
LLPPLPASAVSSVGYAINEAGDIAGTYTDTSGHMHGFVTRFSAGHSLYFNAPAGVSALTVTAINNNNDQVAGYYVLNGATTAFIATCYGSGCF